MKFVSRFPVLFCIFCMPEMPDDWEDYEMPLPKESIVHHIENMKTNPITIGKITIYLGHSAQKSVWVEKEGGEGFEMERGKLEYEFSKWFSDNI